MNFNLSLVLSLSFVCFLQVFSQNIVVRPYLQDIEPNSLYIMWETDGGGTGFVDFGNTPFNLNSTVTSTTVSGSFGSVIHTAELTGLTPNAKYYYQVKMIGGQTSFVYNFKTIPTKNSEAPVKLVAMSDMQTDLANPNKYQEIIEQGVVPVLQMMGGGDLSEKADAILIPGDLVPTGGIYSDWENFFFNPSDSLTPYVPLYPVLGNHEYFLGGDTNFKKYFTLPNNGTVGKEDEWWYKDISNIRIIGLNSNSGSGDQTTQLTWLQNVLDAACIDNDIDFVFVELHHPFKSELWAVGELDFTGDIIQKMENFTTNCGKPSIHFFGHTHSYARGQSRDHNHLWINVATAGGNIDYWGEYANEDYEEIVKSQDEYGFVVVESEAGSDPNFTLKRYSRGDASVTLNNTIRDEITIKRYDSPPFTPVPVFPVNAIANPVCLTLKAAYFYDNNNDVHQASHWQISTSDSNFDTGIVFDSWKQDENWFNEVNTQAGDGLTDEVVSVSLANTTTYYWRVRYRDEHLNWSDWSSLSTFFTSNNNLTTLSSNLIINNGAESGTGNWTGQIEDLSAFECGSVSVYAGASMFAVGGVCSNESSFGTASQDIDVSAYSTDISNNGVFVKFGGYLRNYSGDDIPAMKIAFYDASNTLLETTDVVSNTSSTWTLVERTDPVPINTTSIKIILEGTRNAGTDNDSYFDELSLILQKGLPCSTHEPCPVNITLSNTITNGAIMVDAQETISSTETITGTSIVSYNAGESVTLGVGFCASGGVDFEAYVSGCVP